MKPSPAFTRASKEPEQRKKTKNKKPKKTEAGVKPLTAIQLNRLNSITVSPTEVSALLKQQ